MSKQTYLLAALTGLYFVLLWSCCYFEAAAYWQGIFFAFPIGFLLVIGLGYYFNSASARYFRRAAWSCFGLGTILILRATAPKLRSLTTEGSANVLTLKVLGFFQLIFDSDWRVDLGFLVVAILLFFLGRKLLLDAMGSSSSVNQAPISPESDNVVPTARLEEWLAQLSTTYSCTLLLVDHIMLKSSDETGYAREMMRRIIINKEPRQDVLKGHPLGLTQARTLFFTARSQMAGFRDQLNERVVQIMPVLQSLTTNLAMGD